VSLSDLLIEFAPVVMGLAVLTNRGWRHPRFLVAVIAWLLVWLVAAGILPPPLRQLALLLLVLVFALAVVRPQRLGLLTVSNADTALDETFRRASNWLRFDSRDADTANALALKLEAGASEAHGPDWMVAAALFRRSLLRRGGAAPSTLTSVVAYERAAKAFWRAALDRGMIGRRFRPDAWDQGVALRCYFEEFESLIPRGSLVERPFAPLGGWDEQAARVLESVDKIAIGDPIASRLRDALAMAMADELEISRGDRSDEALARQATSPKALEEHWSALAIREGQALTERDRRDGAARS
jgi:hypothetical protein